jgi:hypothetical protein
VTDAHCTTGCQPSWGTCKSSPPATPVPPSPPGPHEAAALCHKDSVCLWAEAWVMCGMQCMHVAVGHSRTTLNTSIVICMLL